jgi:hypothetical protein
MVRLKIASSRVSMSEARKKEEDVGLIQTCPFFSASLSDIGHLANTCHSISGLLLHPAIGIMLL